MLGHVQTQEHVQVSLHYTFTIIMGSPTLWNSETLKLKRLMPNNPYSVSWMYKASILSILILHIFVLYLYHTFILHLNPAKHHTYHTITIIMDWKLEITLASLQNFDQHFLFSSPSKAEGERFRDYSSSSCLLPGECRLRSCNLHPFCPG